MIRHYVADVNLMMDEAKIVCDRPIVTTTTTSQPSRQNMTPTTSSA